MAQMKLSEQEIYTETAGPLALTAATTIAEAVDHWRFALYKTDRPNLTAIHRIGGAWWLLQARKRVGNGRWQKSPVLLAKLREPPNRFSMFKMLQVYIRDCAKLTYPPDALELGSSGKDSERPFRQVRPEELATAALALARGEPASLAGDWLSEMFATQSDKRPWLKVEHLDWLTLLDQPLREPPPGIGLSLLLVSAESPQLGWTVEQVRSLDLGGLLAAGATPKDRSALIDRALGLTAVALPKAFNPATLVWMTGRTALYQDAYRHLLSKQIDDFVTGLESARIDALVWLKENRGLNFDTHGDKVANLLKQANDSGDVRQPFNAYHDLFPEDRRPRVSLLNPSEMEAWQGLQGEQTPASTPQAIDGLLTRLKSLDLNTLFPLPGLAWACWRGSKSMRNDFVSQLEANGVSPLIADAIVNGKRLQHQVREDQKLPPAWEWLQGVLPKAFLALNDKVAGPAREWWGDGLAILRKKRVIEKNDILMAGLSAGDPVLLRAADAPECVLHLINPNNEPLRLPSDAWPKEADTLLSRMIEDGTLWERIAAPLTHQCLEWLADRLPQFARPLKEGIKALEEMQLVKMPPLSAVASSLRDDWALGQIVPATQCFQGEQRHAVLTALLEGAKLAPEKNSWLKFRLLGEEPHAMPTKWDTHEMIALLPLLNPVNDVLLVVLNNKDKDANVDKLLVRLKKRLSDFRPLVAPPYRREWNQRRPDWVKALGPLLGWTNQE